MKIMNEDYYGVVTFAGMQDEIGQWSALNFGPTRPYAQRIMGIMEELGEYMEALRNEYDETSPKPTIESVAAQRDAVGDMMIYLLDLCFAYGLPLLRESTGELLTRKPCWTRQRAVEYVMVALGRLAHHQLKCEQRIREYKDHTCNFNANISGYVDEIVFGLAHIARMYNTSLLILTHDTWKQVQQRDWLKNRETGA